MRTKEESIKWICNKIRFTLRSGWNFDYFWSGTVNHNGKTWRIFSAAFANQGERIGAPFFRLQNINNRLEEQEFYLDELDDESLDDVVTSTEHILKRRLSSY